MADARAMPTAGKASATKAHKNVGRDPRVAAYVSLLIRVAVNVQQGQALVIWKAPVEEPWFVRMLVDEAYAAGAADVHVFWENTRLERSRVSNTPLALLGNHARPEIDFMEQQAVSGSAFPFFDCTCAGVFQGVSPQRLARNLTSERAQLQGVWRCFETNLVNWSIATVPTESWARKVYPGVEPEVALAALWEDLFAAARLNDSDYRDAWARHLRILFERSRALDDLDLASLVYVAPGTSLEVGLPQGHTWRHPGFQTPSGIQFVPDIPMEEVFTLPHRDRADGIVRITRPLVVNGMATGEFSLRFAGGRLIEVLAGGSDSALIDGLLKADEGARRLGEVAIVTADSVVAELGRLYYNTLFDENSSSHLALGHAYRFCLKGGASGGERQFALRGGNTSSIHVDFMIGSDELALTGVTRTGRRLPILDRGHWVLE